MSSIPLDKLEDFVMSPTPDLKREDLFSLAASLLMQRSARCPQIVSLKPGCAAVHQEKPVLKGLWARSLTTLMAQEDTLKALVYLMHLYGYSLPPEAVPTLLARANMTRQLDLWQVLSVVDQIGTYLIRNQSGYENFLLPESSEEWKNAPVLLRRRFLKRMIPKDPERARGLLQEGFTCESAKTRLELLKAWEHQALDEDADWIRELLNDKSGEIRSLSLHLLMALPGSLEACWLRDIFHSLWVKILDGTLVFKDLPKELQKLLPNRKTEFARMIFGLMPPDIFQGISIREAGLCLKSWNRNDVLEGLASALVRHPYEGCFEAFHRVLQQDGHFYLNAGKLAPVFARLADSYRENMALKWVTRAKHLNELFEFFSPVLMVGREAWSTRLSLAVLELAQKSQIQLEKSDTYLWSWWDSQALRFQTHLPKKERDQWMESWLQRCPQLPKSSSFRIWKLLQIVEES